MPLIINYETNLVNKSLRFINDKKAFSFLKSLLKFHRELKDAEQKNYALTGYKKEALPFSFLKVNIQNIKDDS